MSGFLYGQKKIENTKLWLKKQFGKILIPYYIYSIFIIIIYIIFARDTLTIGNVLSILFCIELFLPMPKGLGHFWFIPVILCCYLITPILQKVIKSREKFGFKEISVLVVIIIGIEVLFLQNLINVGICNLICYILGYLISYFSINNKLIKKILESTIIILAIISNFIKIFLIPDQYGPVFGSMMKMMIRNSHILLGAAIFVILYKLLKCIEKWLKPFIKKILDGFDRYSFYIYITHAVFIVGPFSLIYITKNIFINVILIILCILASSVILEKVIGNIKYKKEKQ